MVDRLHDLMIGVEPDLTFIIDIDAETGLSRARARPGAEQRFEDFGLPLQARMREGFLALAREFPGRCRVIDGSGDEDAVAARVRAALGAAE